MKIIHLTTEFAPIAKAGGLGDVLVGLCRELSRLHADVEVILPKYDLLPSTLSLKKQVSSLLCEEKGVSYSSKVWSCEVENSRLILIDPDHPKGYFHRKTIYGCPDDVPRFLYFCKVACAYLQAKKEAIDVLHLHDWPTAIAAVLARDLFRLPVKKIVLTIHNAEYQGICSPLDLDALGLRGEDYLIEEKLQDDHSHNKHLLNLLKGGVVYADVVNAVSSTYAKEILTPEMGHALSRTFSRYRHKLCGIVNGIDPVLWNPKTDLALPLAYSAKQSFSDILRGKKAAKEAIAKRFQKPFSGSPWVGSITRIVPQKGPELIEAGLRKTVENQGCFLLLGSSPIPSLQHHFDRVKKEFISSPNVWMHFEYDEEFAHQLYAALDFLLMPSHFEPCGLSQLIAMRYGAIPIVRATGGLRDTVIDMDDVRFPVEKRNGIVFEHATKREVEFALQRAFSLFHNEKERFAEMARHIMHNQFDWKESAQQYLALYQGRLTQEV